MWIIFIDTNDSEGKLLYQYLPKELPYRKRLSNINELPWRKKLCDISDSSNDIILAVAKELNCQNTLP